MRAPQLAEDNKPIEIDEVLGILGDDTDDDTHEETHETNEIGALAGSEGATSNGGRGPSTGRSRSRSRSGSRGRIQWRTPRYMKVGVDSCASTCPPLLPRI